MATMIEGTEMPGVQAAGAPSAKKEAATFRVIKKGTVASGVPGPSEEATSLRKRSRMLSAAQMNVPNDGARMVSISQDELISLQSTAAAGMLGWTIIGVIAGFYGMKWLRGNVSLPWKSVAKEVVSEAL